MSLSRAERPSQLRLSVPNRCAHCLTYPFKQNFWRGAASHGRGMVMAKWVERQTRLPVPLGQIKLTDMEHNRQSTKHSSSKAGPLEPLFLSPCNAYSLKALSARHGVQVDSPQEPRLRVKSGGCGQPETPRQITARFHAAAAYRTGKLITGGAICKLTFFVLRRYIPSLFSYSAPRARRKAA